MLCGTVSAFADNPALTPEYLDFTGLAAILGTCTTEEVLYRCTHVTKLHFFLPRGFNQSIGNLHRERLPVVFCWQYTRFSKNIFGKLSSFEVLQVVKFIPKTVVI